MDGKSEMRQCVHRERGGHRGGAERSLPVEWHHIAIQGCAQGTMGVWRPGLEPSGKGPAEVGRSGVDRRRGGDEPKGSHPSLVREKDR